MAMLTTQPLTDRFGVEVSGIDLNSIGEGAGFAALRALFEAQSLLLFRGQCMTPGGHMRLARMFGPVEDRKADERKPGEGAEISEVSNITSEGGLTGGMDLHTLHLKSNLLWHCDSTFMPIPALTNILTAHVVSRTGGATEFASTRAGFADMDTGLQQRLRGVVFRHHYSQSRAKISKELAQLPMFHKWPEQQWPAVWKNPVNGAESAYVASHIRGAVGMTDDAALALVEDVIRHCTQPRYVYSHHWTPGDVILWDQRAVMHRGTPWPDDQPRRLTSLCVSVTEADGLTQMRARAAELNAGKASAA